jgi:hypothetical protein
MWPRSHRRSRVILTVGEDNRLLGESCWTENTQVVVLSETVYPKKGVLEMKFTGFGLHHDFLETHHRPAP